MEYNYRTAAELLDLAARTNLAIGEIALRGEVELSGTPREDLLARMTDYYGRMRASVQKGLAIHERSASGLSGGDAPKVLEHTGQPGVLGAVFERSLAYGLAV